MYNFLVYDYLVFSPSLQELIDVEGDGMADMVFRCIQEMDIDNRMMVWCSILNLYTSISLSQDMVFHFGP